MFSSYRTRHMVPLILMPAVLFLAGPAAATEPSKEAQIEDALSAATPAIGATAKVMDEAPDEVAIKRLLEEESFCALVEADRGFWPRRPRSSGQGW